MGEAAARGLASVEEEALLEWIEEEAPLAEAPGQSERRKARNKKKKERCVGLGTPLG
jgi:hypothetical protein